MATEKMELVNINGRLDDLDKAIGAILKSKSFHIEEGFSHSATGYRQLSEKNPYTTLLKRFTVLATGLGADTQGGDEDKCTLVTPEEFESLYAKISENYDKLDTKRAELDKDIALRSEASLQTSHLKGLNEDISRLFTLEYTSVRFGRLPSDNAKKLKYFERNFFFFFPFDDDGAYTYGMYLCPKSEKEETDEIFKTLFFERTRIPDFVKGSALKAYSDLQSEIAEDKKDLELTESQIHELMEKYRGELVHACAKLNYLKGAYALRKQAGVLKDKFLIKGFIPAKNRKELEQAFGGLTEIELTFLPADCDSWLTPPTVLKNSFLTRPFRMLVGMYGLPVYGGFDPTGLVAVTYSIMFGIMFGDLGQGFLVWLLGLFLGRKNKDLGGMMTRCGFFSMVFGTLYGSVFGIEDMLDPMYESIGISQLPVRAFESTNFILFTAVGIGIFLIVLSMMINIVTSFKRKDIESAVFGCNGICGLIFYASIIFAVVATVMLDMKVMSAPFVIFLIVIPLICIFCRVPFTLAVKYKKWKLSEHDDNMTFGGFFVENFFEMFEFLLSYVSNTMSFLRVGGFVMSHAGMMLVVMTLMDGMSKVGQPIVFVIGNLFVMAMEGMIVAIQIIRLEFYEIFSRFYVSGGKEYIPVTPELVNED